MKFTLNSTDHEYEISDSEKNKILKQHFNLYYKKMAENKLLSHAKFEKINGVYRCLSGIPMPYNNVLIGSPTDSDWDGFIREQLNYFIPGSYTLCMVCR